MNHSWQHRRLFPQRAVRALLAVLLTAALLANMPIASAAAPSPVESVGAQNQLGDDGSKIVVSFPLPTSVADGTLFVIERAGEPRGIYEEVATFVADDAQQLLKRGQNIARVSVGDGIPNKEYWFRVSAVNAAEERSDYAYLPDNAPATGTQEAFDLSRLWLFLITLLVCGSVVAFIFVARFGGKLKIRKIAGLEAIEEAVGRATEMGRSCLYIPGIQDMNDIQTISGLSILSRVAQRAAEYDCELETPTSRSLVMTAARETVQAAFLAAGRPDAYNEDLIYYVTDEQFAYVSYLTGKMVREKPAACFYLGAFYAESLILAETGNSIGAIQVAGTAQPAQLPFFVAACDYTLIGEEFFAASAYLSSDPDQLGSLKGQDVGKIVVGVLILIGVALVSMSQFSDNQLLHDAASYLQTAILSGG